MPSEEVILVNESDQALGTMEKMAAHEQALLHRAFSVFIVNNAGEMLLQQRAFDKYHCG
ncbi:MAG: isopentenyl-diphosphate delta-isomerase, partial [Sphingobacteriia bacterium]